MSVTRRVVLVGFGSVGRGFAELVRDHGERIRGETGCAVQIVGIATRRWCCYAPEGLPLAAMLDGAAAGEFERLPHRQHWSAAELVAHADADVLAEVSPTDLTTAEPATGLIRAAFARGLHVVTANKGPVALYGPALRQEAAAQGVSFGYEGSVMAGTPALRLGWSALAGSGIRRVRGIVNGTTNYILSQMDSGAEYQHALAEAQQLGYAETDPTGDVEGYDAAGKAVILANMLLGGALTLADVQRTGISALTSADVAEAHAAGERWKLIAEVARTDQGIRASVAPARLPTSHPLAGVSGATNAITYTTDVLGDVTLIGPGAGGTATGFALLSDILAIRE